MVWHALWKKASRAEAAVPRERRPRAQLAHRRPRFLCRRKGGSFGLRLVVKGREIIPQGY